MGTHSVASAAVAAGSLSDWHPCGAGVKEGPCTPSGYYASVTPCLLLCGPSNIGR